MESSHGNHVTFCFETFWACLYSFSTFGWKIVLQYLQLSVDKGWIAATREKKEVNRTDSV